jgi:hypothetical protein
MTGFAAPRRPGPRRGSDTMGMSIEQHEERVADERERVERCRRIAREAHERARDADLVLAYAEEMLARAEIRLESARQNAAGTESTR